MRIRLIRTNYFECSFTSLTPPLLPLTTTYLPSPPHPLLFTLVCERLVCCMGHWCDTIQIGKLYRWWHHVRGVMGVCSSCLIRVHRLALWDQPSVFSYHVTLCEECWLCGTLLVICPSCREMCMTTCIIEVYILPPHLSYMYVWTTYTYLLLHVHVHLRSYFLFLSTLPQHHITLLFAPLSSPSSTLYTGL